MHAPVRRECPAVRDIIAPPPCDLRFRRLLGTPAWERLPEAVRRRFGTHQGQGCSATFAGQVVHCRMALPGWLLAQACRLIGAPLPLDRAAGMAALVSVTEDAVGGGQVWTRVYARPGGFPQVIHSAKRFAGPTGLEEYLGGGFGIALTTAAITGGIRFSSDHYFLRLGRLRQNGVSLRLRLPRWLAPGRLMIDHCDLGDGAFDFTLLLRHPLLGDLIHQHCRFRDRTERTLP